MFLSCLIELVSLSNHSHQANLSMLALRVVIARVLFDLSGSFMSKTEIGLTLTQIHEVLTRY